MYGRDYDAVRDAEQLAHICRNVFNGTDRVPRALPAYVADPLCRPRVLVSPHTNVPVAFANVRQLASGDARCGVVYVEAVRVAEEARGQGLGLRMTEDAMRVAQAWGEEWLSSRILSTTVPRNARMRRIFERLGWACQGCVNIWPSHEVMRRVSESGVSPEGNRMPLLDALQLSAVVPEQAAGCVSKWRQTTNKRQVLNVLHRLYMTSGSNLLPCYYAVDTAQGGVETFCGENAGRSVWLLEQEGKTPGLLFITLQNTRPSWPSPDQVISVCVADVETAECALALLATLPQLDHFRIALSPAVTSEAIASSALLSSIPTSVYMIYEANP